MPQKRFEIAQGAILGPEGVLVEKALQLDQTSHWLARRSQAKPAQTLALEA